MKTKQKLKKKKKKKKTFFDDKRNESDEVNLTHAIHLALERTSEKKRKKKKSTNKLKNMKKNFLYQKKKKKKEKRSLRGVPPETAQKIDFLKQNVTRNRAAIEAKKDFEHPSSEKDKEKQRKHLNPGP